MLDSGQTTQTDPQLGFSVYDVTGALQDGANEARLQSYDSGTSGDNMYAATVILVAEYTETTLPDLVVTGITPNAGEIFAHEPNNITATVANIGDAAAGYSQDGHSGQGPRCSTKGGTGGGELQAKGQENKGQTQHGGNPDQLFKLFGWLQWPSSAVNPENGCGGQLKLR